MLEEMRSTAKMYAELEVSLHRVQAEAFQVELRFSTPQSEAELPPARGLAALQPAQLLTLHSDPAAYGKLLTKQLFADPEVKALYARAKTAVETAELSLRLRLVIGPSVPELQALRWELLRDPESNAPFATSEKTLFSRFMLSQDWRPVRLRPKAELTGLVAVAAPSNLDQYRLAEIDVKGEIKRARKSLEGIRVTLAGQDEPLTLKLLVQRLRAGVDVLYLVCHGTIHRQSAESVLFLQQDDRRVDSVRGADLAERLAELTQPPRLVVLASCESAGTEAGTADKQAPVQWSLAPRLAEAGIPAILAMQGKISMETVKQAMPVFFRELILDGRIDRALAVARAAVRERPDFWMPALYLRLKGGRIWYEPGFTGVDDEFKKWRSICSSVRQGTVVPIVGPVLDERIRGTRGDLARHLAKKHGFPLAPHQRGDLAKVTQFLAVRESRRFARTELLQELSSQIVDRHPELEADAGNLKKLFKAIIRQRFKKASDPFRALAELRARVYISAAPESLLPLALAEAGTRPKPLYSTWRKTKDSHPQEPRYEGTPDPENPIVYYPFGFIATPDTLVLTEDDFVDYLIATADYKLIPRVVRGTLVESSLLFVGFTLDDWSFRVLYRLIMALDGSADLADFTHIGVQVDPSENDLADVEQARQYLQAYLGGRDTAPIDIYWGTASDFLNELRDQLAKAEDEPIIVDQEDEDDWVNP